MTERDTFVTVSDGDQLNEGYFNGVANNCRQELGEVRMFALSITGAVTKANLQARGWAICDGTTPAAQGISDADITAATPNMDDKFIRMSDDESSGGTGGADSYTHNHQWGADGSGGLTLVAEGEGGSEFTDTWQSDGSTAVSFAANQPASVYTKDESVSSLPSYYELVFFIKVKIV